MFKTIEGAADCEIWSVIRFLKARNVLPSEINHQICQVYGDDDMSVGVVRKWVGMFNERRENLHNEARSGRPSSVRKVNETATIRGRLSQKSIDLNYSDLICHKYGYAENLQPRFYLDNLFEVSS